MKTLFKRCSALVLAAAGLCALPERAAATYAEDFDSYVTGSMIAGQGGWESWDNNNAYNSMVVAGGFSTPNRIRITGASDSVRQLSGYTSGKWVFRAKQFVASSSVGDSYLILLNRYAHGGPYSWSVQLRCNAASGVIQENRTGSGPSLPLVTNAWKEIRCEIDISANTVAVYYDNQLLVTQPWKIPSDPNAQNALACIDLYSDNPGSLAYYDDIRVDPGGPLLAFGNLHSRIGGAVLEVQNSPLGQRVRSAVTLEDTLISGFAVADGTTDGTCIVFDPLDSAATPIGASMLVEIKGSPPGEPVTNVCGVDVTKWTDWKFRVSCVPGRSYQEYTIECYLEDQLVGGSPNGPGGAGPELLQWPYWMESRTKKECRPFHHHSIFVPPGGPHDQGDLWIGLGRMDEPGHGVQLVTLPNGTSALCNLIRIVPAPQPGLASYKSAGYNVKQNKACGTATVTGEMRYAFGHAVKSLGNDVVVETDMASSSRRLRLSNLGSSGEDGAEFHTCPGNGMDAVWDPITAPPVDGAFIQMEAEGMLNGTHHRLGQTQCRYRPAFFDIFCDFRDIGASSMRVVGRLNGAVVFDDPNVPNGFLGTAAGWPRCGGKLGRPTPCFRWWWPIPGPFLFGGSVFLIDELLMLADGPPGTEVDDLDVLRFKYKDIQEVTFTDFVAEEYKMVEITPTLEGCPDPVGQVARYEVRLASNGQVIQEGYAAVGPDGKLKIKKVTLSASIRPPTISIHIEFGRYLHKNSQAFDLESYNEIAMAFKAGDADGDNEVSIGDFALLSAAFGSSPGMPNWNPMCDFDCDDEITIGDYALLSTNFGEVGDD